MKPDEIERSISFLNQLIGTIEKLGKERDEFQAKCAAVRNEPIVTFLKKLKALPTCQNCPPDNHWIVAEAMELLEKITEKLS